MSGWESAWLARWSSLPVAVRDSAPAVPVALFLAVSALAAPAAAGWRDVAGVVALSCTVLALLSLRRRHPRAVWLAALALAVLVPAVARDDTVGFLTLTVAAYSVIAHDPATRAATVLGASVAAAVAGQVALAVVTGGRLSAGAVALPVLALVYPVGLGLAVRVNRRHVRELAQRAEELERLRAVEAREAVLEERARIARELHDVVAHHVSGVVVQAKAGRRVVGRFPDQAREALDEIIASSVSALASMRRLVGMLRDVDSGEPLPPQPTVADVTDLVAAAGRGGAPVSLRVEGGARTVADDVGLSAYRIVQEALTNVRRHARARRAEVAIVWGARELRVVVDDDGIGHGAGTPAGNGMIGMHERAALCGGTVLLGRSPLGGTRVEARLPLAPVAPAAR